MAFDKTKPTTGGPLNSEPVRENFQALANHHAGPSEPLNPEEGWVWHDTANRSVKVFKDGAWRDAYRFDASGNVVFDGGIF